MAGIGFVLRRLTSRDDLLGVAQGYAYAAFVASGPWLFTVLSLAAVGLFGRHFAGSAEVDLFRIILSYNFCFSLVATGPACLVLTRWLADSIYGRSVEDVPTVLLAAFAATTAGGVAIAAPFYLLVADIDPRDAALAVANFVVVAAIWLLSTFLSALKDYRAIALAFLGGMATAFAAAVGLASLGVPGGLLAGFTAGLAVILFVLLAKILAEYPYALRSAAPVMGHVRRFGDLALLGFVSNAAIWADKWILWFAPEAERPAHGLLAYTAYDGAMFLAYLSVVPITAVFVVNIETAFFETYKRYYADILTHADRTRIEENRRAIGATLVRSARTIGILQSCIAALVILLSAELVRLGLLGPLQLGMFRIGVLGGAFHVWFVFCCVVLAYFDRRQDLLWLNTLFLVLNVGLSFLTLRLGFPFYGYGYFLASVIAMAAAYATVVARASDLSFLTFLRQNSSV